MLIKPAFLSKLWQEQIPADYPLGVSARNLPLGRTCFHFCTLHMPIRGSLSLSSALETQPAHSVALITVISPAARLVLSSHASFHLCVIPVWLASHPSLCLCFAGTSPSLTSHTAELIHETQRSTQLLDHSLSGKGKELVLMSYLTCVQL